MNSTNTTNESAATQTAGESHSQIKNRQSSIVNRQSAPTPTAPPPQPKKFIDTWDIPFPKTLAELAALNATREIPYLKAHCNRRGIHVPGPNPTPAEIIPYIQKRLDTHNTNIPQHRTEHSDVYFEWKLTLQDLTEFLQNLRNLLPAPIPPSASSAHFASSALNSPPQSAISNLHSKIEKTSGHSNNSNAQQPKNPAIQTKTSAPPKTLGHSNNPSEKINPTLPNRPPQISNPQSSPHFASANVNTGELTCGGLGKPIVNRKSPSALNPSEIAQPSPPHPQSEIPNAQSTPSTPARPRRNNPVLALLTHEQKQQLIDLYQNHPATEAVKIAAETLNIKISVGTLSNLATTWQIAEDQTTREDLEATHNTTIENLTQQQLQLRLLELASRPNMDTSELRAICQSFARLESVKLSERRVQLAEAKEARIAKNDQPLSSFSPEKCQEGLRVMLGKLPNEDTPPRGSRGNEAQTNSKAPQAVQGRSAHPTSSEITAAKDSDWASSGNLVT